MNATPNAAQKRFHAELRELYYELHGTACQLHHVFGSKWKRKGFVKPGDWILIALDAETHRNIKQYSFESERGLFLEQIRQYERYFNKPAPVPAELIASYKSMLNRHETTKGNPL